jgi:hypothetical protein
VSKSFTDPQTRQTAAQRWEAFYQRELRLVGKEIRSGRLTAERVEEASKNRRLNRARAAVNALRDAGSRQALATKTQIQSAVRADLAHVIAYEIN